VSPRGLHIRVGGYPGPWYSVELLGEVLRYEAKGRADLPTDVELFEPTERQWQEFAAALDALGVWRWRANYPNPGVMDGTSWSIDIDYGRVAIRAGGDNNYPAAGGAPSGKPEPTREFRGLLTAVRNLIGGRPFA
jgi:hypothetical protein